MTKLIPVSRDLQIVIRELAAQLEEFQLSWAGKCESQAQWMAYAPHVGVYFADTPRDALQLLLAASQSGARG